MKAKHTVILLAVCLGFILALTAKDKKPRSYYYPKDAKLTANTDNVAPLLQHHTG